MEVKFLRFLELSSEFCEEPDDYRGSSSYVVPESTMASGRAYSGIEYLGSFSTAIYANTVPPSRLEQFKSQKQAEIEKAERWEEFLELKKDLKQYLEAKIKLTK